MQVAARPVRACLLVVLRTLVNLAHLLVELQAVATITVPRKEKVAKDARTVIPKTILVEKVLLMETITVRSLAPNIMTAVTP